MRKATLTAVLLCLCFAFTYAQSSTSLKGPRAKNHKPWHHKNRFFKQEPYVRLTGPKAKNRKPWHGKSPVRPEVLMAETRFKHPTGPKAKNLKPWQDKVDRPRSFTNPFTER